MNDLALMLSGIILCFLFLLMMHLLIDGDLPRWLGGPKQ